MTDTTRSVLIPAAGTGTAFAIATRLRANWSAKINVITADINPSYLVASSLYADKHFQVSPSTSREYRDELIKIIGNNSVSNFVPLLNADFSIACELQNVIPDCDFWTSELIANLASSKRGISKWLKGLELAVPREFSLSEITPEQKYFAKPDNGSGSRDARSIRGAEVMKLQSSDWIVQEVCSGPEVTVDSFFDYSVGMGRAVARERLETKSGVSTKARVFENSELTEMAAVIGNAIKQRGTICFQVMKSNGRFRITDLNFRTGAGTAMTVAAGVDVISAAFACRWGEDYSRYLKHDLPADGVFVTRQYSEFVM